jgi:DNA-binding transcriptional ArsR family regulator
MDYEQRVIVRFLCKEGVLPAEIHTRVEAQFGEDAYSLRSVQRWCQLVRHGREDLHDGDRLGRSTLDFIDSKIMSLLEREPFHTAYSLAEAIGVSHSTVLRHLHDSFAMKNFHLRWIPHRLTEDLRQKRVSVCKEMLSILEAQNKRGFHDLVTDDESWFMLEYEHEAQWAVSREKVAPRVKPIFQSPKFMFTIIWGTVGFYMTNLMTSQRSFNSEYFINEIMQPLIAKLFPMGRIPYTHRLIVNLHNCRVHFSKHSQKFFDDNSLLRLPQPSYSPDLTLLTSGFSIM